MDQQVAIIGAGMAGLGAARTLQQQGISVTVFDTSHKAGGRMTTEDFGGFRVDVGASFVLRYFNTVAPLVQEIGLSGEMQSMVHNGAALFRDGKFHRVSLDNRAALLSFTGLSTRAKLSALGAVPEVIKNFSKLSSFADVSRGMGLDDGENAYEWLVRKTSRELADYLGDAICRALCCYSLREMSKLNFLTYALMLKDTKLFTFKHGMGSVPQRLAADMDMKYSTKVLNVVQRHKRVEVTYQTGSEAPVTRDFAAAVVASWGDTVPDLVSGLSDAEVSVFRNTQYSKTATVVMTLDRPLEESFYGVYLDPNESKVLASFGVEDAKGNLGVPTGKGCLLALTRDEFARSFHGTDEELCSLVAEEARRFFPHIAGHISAVYVKRWERAIEKFPPGRFTALAEMKAKWPADRRIHVAGAYLVAPCTDGAFHSGRLAAAKVIMNLGTDTSRGGVGAEVRGRE